MQVDAMPCGCKACNFSASPTTLVDMEGRRAGCTELAAVSVRRVVSEPWSDEEDARLARLVERIGKKDWCMISSVMEGRTARQCRERYCNQVDESINRGLCA